MLAYSHSTRYQVRRYCCLWRLGIHIDMTNGKIFRIDDLFRKGVFFEEHIEGVTPWAWAANGCASVVAGVAAAMLALGFGFDAVVWCGATAYAGALALLGRPRPRAGRQGLPG